jgi:sulfite dehydrogenase (quinone) subunit SoeB
MPELGYNPTNTYLPPRARPAARTAERPKAGLQQRLREWFGRTSEK